MAGRRAVPLVRGERGPQRGVPAAEGEELVDTMLVEPVTAGDLLLVHAGSAITRLAEEAGTR